MLKLILLLFLISPVLIYSQTEHQGGIKFEKNLSWEQVKAKAKAENKFIFVDCFATWCGPCKLMDKNVYPAEKVGEAVNEKLISLKVQLDTSSKDGEEIKKWYQDAHYIATEYKIAVLPTYLFFSPAGELVHKGIGGKTSSDFIAMVNDALMPEKQFYSIVKKYHQEQISYNDMPDLASKAKQYGEVNLSEEINKNYIANYLNSLDTIEFLSQKNIKYITVNSKLIDTKSKIFEVVGLKNKYIDSIMNEKGYASRLQYSIIYNTLVVPGLNKAMATQKNPNWGEMESMLKQRYNKKIVGLAITEAKTRWFKYSKDWKNYTRYLLQQTQLLDSTDPRTKNFFYLNGVAWDIFQYSKNKNELTEALKLAEKALPLTTPKLRDAIIDTKANLLYKLGKNKEAIDVEEIAVQLNSGFKPNLDKMRQGIPTWNEN